MHLQSHSVAITFTKDVCETERMALCSSEPDNHVNLHYAACLQYSSLAALTVVECSVSGYGPSGCGSILVAGLKMKSENKRIHAVKIIESRDCKVVVILEEERGTRSYFSQY